MEEELLKRNTDCVYFLASPLTCKKGMDCEYRHCEIARLNPRDCWYWLAGSCINPTCCFRHPPLDGHPAEARSESDPLSFQSSMPLNKTSVPCYFYFNGFCNKGDRCSFLHGTDATALAGMSSKIASETADVHSSENKTFMGNYGGTGPRKEPPNPSEIATKPAVVMTVQPKGDNLQSAPRSIPLQSVSPQISLSEGEDAGVIKSDFIVPAEGFIKTRSHLCTEWSSEEQVDDHVEHEERWESSPGFDVLVDSYNRSQNLGFDNDPEYLLAINRDHRDLNSHFSGYEFEDPIEFDPIYPDAKVLYEREMYSAYDSLNSKYIVNNDREPPIHARERMLDSILSRKRKFLPMKLPAKDRCVDLRDYLRKRRIVDGCHIIRSSRRHESCRLIVRSQERPPRGHVPGQWLNRRLASEVGKNYIESYRGNGALSNRAEHRESLGDSQSSRFRQHYKEKRLVKRQSYSSEVSRKPVSRERRSSQASTAFTGPKTLAEIKEEKKKAEDIGDCFGKEEHSSIRLTDFQGPKPLSEILKEKRRL